jgi:23S rRNA (cytosine1962-C5)-methyltransferase
MSAPTPNHPRLRLRITAAAETVLRGGHPWLYSDSVREQNREGRAGELAVVFDRQDRFLAIGLYDPDSPIRLRVLHVGKPVNIDGAWWRERLCAALARREGLFDTRTDGYRCIHGESDGWPGLVLDRYGEVFVLKLYSAVWLPRLDEVCALIVEVMKPRRLVLRLSRNIQAAAKELGRAEGQTLSPFAAATSEPDFVTFLETGLRFEADVARGQKTGFFLDQRENRRRIESLAEGRDVLNAFSFSGGFSLYAARGGAKSVTDLDISPHALESARRNFALNRSDPAVLRCPHETVQADTFDWLERNRTPRFDLVILDPPSLAKREAERVGAIRAYVKLAEGGIRILRPGGVLVAASCSAHVTTEEFFSAVRESMALSRRPLQEIETTGHPPDHPAAFPEARYLKCIYLQA